MLRGHPRPLPGRRRAVCFVANDFDYVMRNGGIGTFNWLMSRLLSARGWDVHVLYCGITPSRRDMQAAAQRLRGAGISWSCLHDFEQPAELAVEGVTDTVQAYLSERVRYVLEELHARHDFDLIEFGEWGALGFRSVQAKRCGLAFGDVRLAVRLHSSSQWMREGNRRWPGDLNEVVVDYCERYAFEHADIQLSPSRYMLDYARSVGWAVRPDARVVPYPYPEPEFVPTHPPQSSCPELVFFGRLETRKGLEVFVGAVRQLDPQIPVTFLGRVNTLADGTTAAEYIRRELSGRPYTLLTDYNREEALRYLAGGDRLAVIASLSDNSPFTVIECAANGLPFVASRVGGVPEILPDECFQHHLLFEPNTPDLLRRLRAYLDLPAGDRAELCEAARLAADVPAHNRIVADLYEELSEPESPRPHAPRGDARPDAPRPVLSGAGRDAERRQQASPRGAWGREGESDGDDAPLVTVAIPYFNMGPTLPETLASLAAQTYPNLEVLVIDDGSTDPHSRQVFEEQRALYPQFRFLSQPNAGIGATRNRGLAEARGEFFLPMDADNVARPHMVERFVAALRRNPGVAALTCFYLAFRDTSDLQSGEHPYAYRPTGGPHVLAGVTNHYGDANALFRTDVFRAVGGYETDRDCSFEDLEAFVKLVNAGHRLDVLPEYLFYYRHLAGGFSRVTSGYLNHRRVLRQYFRLGELPTAEGMALWTALIGLQQRNEAMALRLTSLRYRVADQVHALFAGVPGVKKGIKWLLQSAGRGWHVLTTPRGAEEKKPQSASQENRTELRSREEPRPESAALRG